MAWVSTKEIASQRRSTYDVNGNLGAQKVYRILFSSEADELSAITAPGLPAWGSQHPNAGGFPIYATDFQCDDEGVNDGKSWLVRINYTTITNNEVNPLLQPPVGSWSTSTLRIAAWQDRDGKALLNKAGVPIEGAETEVTVQSLSVSKNETVSPSEWNQMACTVNDDIFQGYAADHAKYNGATGSQQTYIDQQTGAQTIYWANVHSFDFTPLQTGWATVLLNQGYQCLKDVGGGTKVLFPIYDGNVPTTTPKLLANDGTLLAQNGTPVFLTFNLLNKMDFSVFGFPTF